jgi:hypothetical protein
VDKLHAKSRSATCRVDDDADVGHLPTREWGFTPQQVVELANDFHDAGLEPVDVAIMELAQKVALNAYKVTQDDVAGLRAFGLTDADVFDIVLTAAARAFFSKSLDAMSAEPDEVYVERLGEDVVAALAVGRPFPLLMRPPG